MSLLAKIKYFFDGAEEAEESGLILSRRKFFIGSAALIVAAPVAKWGLSPIEQAAKEHGFSIGYTIEDGGDFFAPGAIELQRYQEETLKQVRTKFILKPMVATVSFTTQDLDGTIKSFKDMAVPIQQRMDRDLNRKLWEAKKLGYRGRCR